MMGAFSASDALCAIAICGAFGVTPAQAATTLAHTPVQGRFEVVEGLPGRTFIVDYSHNGLALTSALKTLRAYDPHRLLCVFGSVGGRTQVRRKELAEEIKEARSHGDLSENSEYDEAKNTQGLVENRITELEQMVKNAVVIDESELSVENVSVGTHVTIQMDGEDEKEEYDIVGRTEADPLNGKISDESPVGHALLGKAVGEKAEVLLPSGHTVEYTVLSIAHSIN